MRDTNPDSTEARDGELMRVWILGLLLLGLCQEATAADSVVSGRAISNAYIDYVKIDCPKGDICMDAWFKWTIDAKKTLRGPPVTGRVAAVRMQHSTVIPSYERRLRLFVLRPIENPKWRALLRSDYYLVSTSLTVPGAAYLSPVRGHPMENAYKIVPSGQGTYTIHVPTERMLAPAERVCPPPTCPLKVPVTQLPDVGTASNQAEQLARDYCGKTHKTLKITGGGFDMGPGLTFIFKCVAPQQGALVQPTKVYLTISSSGACSIDEHNIDCSEISRYVRSLNIQHGCHILIHADERARYAEVAAALKSLQAAGGLCKIGSVVVGDASPFFGPQVQCMVMSWELRPGSRRRTLLEVQPKVAACLVLYIFIGSEGNLHQVKPILRISTGSKLFPGRGLDL